MPVTLREIHSSTSTTVPHGVAEEHNGGSLEGGAQGRWAGATTCAERGRRPTSLGVTSLQANPVL